MIEAQIAYEEQEMKEKSCPFAGQEEKTNADEEQKVLDEPCVEKVLVTNSDAEFIVDLGNNNVIPKKLKDKDVVCNAQMVDNVMSQENKFVLLNMKNIMEVVQNAEKISMTRFGDGVQISLTDQASIQIHGGEMIVLFCASVPDTYMMQPFMVDDSTLYFAGLILGSIFSSGEQVCKMIHWNWKSRKKPIQRDLNSFVRGSMMQVHLTFERILKIVDYSW